VGDEGRDSLLVKQRAEHLDGRRGAATRSAGTIGPQDQGKACTDTKPAWIGTARRGRKSLAPPSGSQIDLDDGAATLQRVEARSFLVLDWNSSKMFAVSFDAAMTWSYVDRPALFRWPPRRAATTSIPRSQHFDNIEVIEVIDKNASQFQECCSGRVTYLWWSRIRA
jgi:hypothetical protein